jgi:tetratricopeptide (TPR) repeat protein
MVAYRRIEEPELTRKSSFASNPVRAIFTSDLGRAVAVLVGLVLLAVLVTAQPESGTGVYRSASEDSDGNLFGNYLAARHATYEKDTRAAAGFYRNAVEEDPDNNIILERAFLLELSSGNLPGAVDLAERLVKIDPSHRLSRYVLGVIDLRARQFQAARRQFELSDQRGPIGEMVSTLLVAWSYQGSGDTAKALETIDSLEGPEWFGVFKSYHSALIAELSGRTNLARAHYTAAYEADNSLYRIVEGYSRFLARNGEADKAIEILEDYQSIIPNHPIITALLAQVRGGETPDPIIRSTPEGASEGLYGIGSALARERGSDLAIVFLEFARHLSPESPQVLVSLGNIHEQNENYALAIETYNLVSKSSPFWPGAQIQAALNLSQLDRDEEAINALRNLIIADPSNQQALESLGYIFRTLERYDEAVEVFSSAINQLDEITPDDWRLLYSRGISYERLKNWPSAEADLVKALELAPGNPQVLNYLGYSWIDQGMYLNRAMDMIRQAVEQRPDDGYIVDSLGWAHYQLGDYEEAVTVLERAVHLKPDDAVINDHLGDAYWRAGRRLEAKFQWEQARVFDPDPEALVQIESKLADGLPDVQLERTAGEDATANGT